MNLSVPTDHLSVEVMNRISLLFSLSLLCLCGSVDAGIITIEPAPGANGGNNFPFPNFANRWQQIYDDSFFGNSPLLIQSIGFRSRFNSNASYGPDFSIRMSTSSIEPGSLSNILDANVGTDETLVYQGPIDLITDAGEFFSIAFTTPFVYDPNAGNLLVEFDHNGPTSGIGVSMDAFANPGAPSGTIERAYVNSSNPNGITATTGTVVTRFETFAAVPEPSSLSIFGIGALLGSIVSRRNRRFRDRGVADRTGLPAPNALIH